MVAFEQLGEKSVQNQHLSTRARKLLVEYGLHTVRVHRPVEQEWMRANFAELHHCVLKLHVIDFLHCVAMNQSAVLFRLWG